MNISKLKNIFKRKSRIEKISILFKLPKDKFYVWGLKPSGIKTKKRADFKKIRVVHIEDSFISSISINKSSYPLGLCLDSLGIYYDSRNNSHLEELIKKPLNQRELKEAKIIKNNWIKYRLSKYNDSLESKSPKKPFILLADQTKGDLSIQYGYASKDSFERMLKWALKNWPNYLIVVKVHPDVAKGYKTGYLYPQKLSHPNLIFLMDGGHPTDLIEKCHALCVVTSQLGFEGLIWGKEVHVFGSPFYAGWGLTIDHGIEIKRRLNHFPSLEQLIFSCLSKYCIYRHPETNSLISIIDIMEWVKNQREIFFNWPNNLQAFKFTPYKARQLRKFIPRARGQKIEFINFKNELKNIKTFVWGMKNLKIKKELDIIRVEDGFIRSVGLGSHLNNPISLIFDKKGIYYDASNYSDLEIILNSSKINNSQIKRAKNLQDKILKNDLSKYNLNSAKFKMQIDRNLQEKVLILGQVETDSSIKFGIPEESKIKTNFQLVQAVKKDFPNSLLFYKPHPDVLSGMRQFGKKEKEIYKYCHEIIYDLKLNQLIDYFDRVCVLTSLGGFEALIRGKLVTTYGIPFYAGWGLTEDKLTNHRYLKKRKNKSLKLEELIYHTLISYPVYLSFQSGRPTNPEQALEELTNFKNLKEVLNLEKLIFRWWGAIKDIIRRIRYRKYF